MSVLQQWDPADAAKRQAGSPEYKNLQGKHGAAQALAPSLCASYGRILDRALVRGWGGDTTKPVIMGAASPKPEAVVLILQRLQPVSK